MRRRAAVTLICLAALTAGSQVPARLATPALTAAIWMIDSAPCATTISAIRPNRPINQKRIDRPNIPAPKPRHLNGRIGTVPASIGNLSSKTIVNDSSIYGSTATRDARAQPDVASARAPIYRAIVPRYDKSSARLTINEDCGIAAPLEYCCRETDGCKFPVASDRLVVVFGCRGPAPIMGRPRTGSVHNAYQTREPPDLHARRGAFRDHAGDGDARLPSAHRCAGCGLVLSAFPALSLHLRRPRQGGEPARSRRGDDL